MFFWLFWPFSLMTFVIHFMTHVMLIYVSALFLMVSSGGFVRS